MNPLLLQALVALLRTPKGRLNPSQLATALRVTPAVAAQTLGAMWARGWAAPQPGLLTLTLTQAGERAAWWVGAREHLSLTRSERARLDAEHGVPS